MRSAHLVLQSQGIGQIEIVELAHNSPYQPYIASDHPEPPFPVNTAPASVGNPGSQSSEFLSATQPTPSPRASRRRRSSPDNLASGPGHRPESARETASQDNSHLVGRPGRSPPPKRRRLVIMRPDGMSAENGYSEASNGTLASRKIASNGQTSTNGRSHTNGANTSQSSTYYGHSREEVTRILIQSLYELGYNESASLLSSESGYELETPGVATFRSAVLGGRWSEAERILIQSFRIAGAEGDRKSSETTLVLAEGADRNEMLFYLRQQKFLELLEARDLAAALCVLRQELTPLNFDVERLHALSRYRSTDISFEITCLPVVDSLLMCPTELLHAQAGWDGPVASSRERLLGDLSSESHLSSVVEVANSAAESISPSVMIPQHRLAILLDQVKQTQINNCFYHNTADPPSLYSDHTCDRTEFPLEVSVDLTPHTDEVWYCEFSHDGSKLVTAGKDHAVVIYDTSDFRVIHKLTDHEEGVAFASWSPDDSKLITCSQDKRARVWSVEVRLSFRIDVSMVNYMLTCVVNGLEWSLSAYHQPSPPTSDCGGMGGRW